MLDRSSTVQHDPPFADAVASGAVAAAADRELQPGLAGQQDDAGDVAGVGGLDDDGGVAVDAADEHGAGLVVVGIPRRDHPTLEGVAQLRDRDGGGVGGREVHGSSFAAGSGRGSGPVLDPVG
jgi:hypothetical protein